jgi:hypothetical protein
MHRSIAKSEYEEREKYWEYTYANVRKKGIGKEKEGGEVTIRFLEVDANE